MKNLNTLTLSDPGAQGLSAMSADSARFAKTLNSLLISDTPTNVADAVATPTSVNDLLVGKPKEKSPPPPLKEYSGRIDMTTKPRLTPEGELDQKAHELVGTTFFATLLKQMHDSPFKSELFSGGRGGEAFGGMYDQILSQRMSQRGAEKLVRPIVKKFEKAAKDAYDRQNRNQKSLNEAKSDVPSNLRA